MRPLRRGLQAANAHAPQKVRPQTSNSVPLTAPLHLCIIALLSSRLSKQCSRNTGHKELLTARASCLLAAPLPPRAPTFASTASAPLSVARAEKAALLTIMNESSSLWREAVWRWRATEHRLLSLFFFSRPRRNSKLRPLPPFQESFIAALTYPHPGNPSGRVSLSQRRGGYLCAPIGPIRNEMEDVGLGRLREEKQRRSALPSPALV